MLRLWVSCLCMGITTVLCHAAYTVTIYPQYLSQNGRTHFEADRWNGHNHLDSTADVARVKAIGSENGRWLKKESEGDPFMTTPEDPHRKGYPDPRHFKQHSVQERLVAKYMINLDAYGKDLGTILTLSGQYWPHWMNTSKHGGIFPNNIDAGAELVCEMIEGMSQGTGGIIPPYVEPINEPDWIMKDINWTTTIEYHKVLAKKLKSKFHKLNVGGPVFTFAISEADETDFRIWKMARSFLDMSLYHMDFFAYHPYNYFYSLGGSHHFKGIGEARFVAVMDLIGSYSHQKVGHSTPLVFSEYGLGVKSLDSHVSVNLVRWAYAYTRNSFLFTMLNYRDVMEGNTAFLAPHTFPQFANASIFNHDGSETFVATTFRFWKSFHYNQQFLRVDSEYDGAERTVSPLAVADPHTKKVTVLLHNYKQASVQVKLHFYNNWISPTGAHATCISLDSRKIPHFTEIQPVRLQNQDLTLTAEASCFYTFQTTHNFAATATVKEDTYYSREQATSIHNNTIQTIVTLPPSGRFQAAKLRFAVSTSQKAAHTTPRAVLVNGHSVKSHYTLHDTGRPYAKTLWDVFLYQLSPSFLKHGPNTVKLEFNNVKGYVSTVALVVESLSENNHVVG